MFITQLLNCASSMTWAAIQKKKKETITPAAMRHQHQMYMRFLTLHDGRNEKGQT